VLVGDCYNHGSMFGEQVREQYENNDPSIIFNARQEQIWLFISLSALRILMALVKELLT
jgi:hypothetical protein